MMVGDDGTRRLACVAECLLEECLSRGGVAVLPEQHVHHLAVLVDGAGQVPLVLAAEEEHLVGVPAATEWPTGLASFSRLLWPKSLDPAQHGAVRHVDGTVGEQ